VKNKETLSIRENIEVRGAQSRHEGKVMNVIDPVALKLALAPFFTFILIVVRLEICTNRFGL
jgi:hypothetical protein